MKRSLAGIVALIVMLPASCGLRPERVTIGVALSPTFHPGIELATQEINAAGGIKGAPLELVGLDFVNVFDRDEIQRWAQRFTKTEGLVAVIGHSDSASTLSAAGGDSLSTARFLDRDPAAKEGIRVSHFFVPLPDNRRAADFMRNYRLVAGREPDYGSAMAYDGAFRRLKTLTIH